MDTNRIRVLLQPFSGSLPLSDAQVEQISMYMELLRKWNEKISLTAIREPEEVVQRHFGESWLAAGQIASSCGGASSIADFGSGAGFPGLPIKIAIPQLKLTLIESQLKKAVFLREVIRTLGFSNAEVSNSRGESMNLHADVVTLRAVESFADAVQTAAGLVNDGGWLVLLIGASQASKAASLLPTFAWAEPKTIPMSSNRFLLVGRNSSHSARP